MSGSLSCVKRVLGCAALVSVILGASARAQGVSEEQILKALSPASVPHTRSLSPMVTPTSTSAGDAAFVDSVRNRSTRSLSTGDRQKLGDVAANKPQIDLPMEFAYNSDVLQGDALASADKLGRALISSSMKGQTFMIAGHTDAKGSDEHNMSLSERRADAVKQYLVKTYKIPPTNLITVGYGKSRLKTPNDPNGGENRRVQAVNMLQTKTAGQ